MERPALRLDEDGRLHLAAAGVIDRGSRSVLGISDDGGQSWSELGTLDLRYRLLPHVTPVWLQERAVFATLDTMTGSTKLCAGSLSQDAVCIDSGFERILKLGADGDTLYTVADVAAGEWEFRSWTTADFEE